MSDPYRLDPAVPCALLPVRLETRIRARGDGLPGDELVCRIYPDDIHLDGHDPALTADEIAFGRGYWEQFWDAEGAPDADARRRLAWQQLATRVTPTRAAWVTCWLSSTICCVRPSRRWSNGGSVASSARSAFRRAISCAAVDAA